MRTEVKTLTAVAAIRVSTTKQGSDGDSPEAQKEQITRFAEAKGITIKKFFTFLESASKEEQPMQEVVNYCKDPKNSDLDIFIIKSIDRFTRGGGSPYDQLKLQLEHFGVQLVDIYGIISSQKVNTLEHLGVKYKWSEYSPSQKMEYLEAERAKDELRDIMSRMIGAEVRYTRLGYWMRQSPYGYVSEKVETHNGKRCILKPHPKEGQLMSKMYELRAQGLLHDQEIVDKLNTLGFKTRVRYKRSKHDRSKIVCETGGQPLTVKNMQWLIQNPIYAGVNVEKWTDNKPVRCAFEGLVSMELYNKANRGKRYLSDEGDKVIFTKKRPPEHLVNKGAKNAEFPYRKFVMCPTCQKPLYGSTSRGRSGKLYPAYHCSNRGHSYRISKQELEQTAAEFVSNLIVSDDQIDAITEAITDEWQARQHDSKATLLSLEQRIAELEMEAKLTIEKIKILHSETAINYMEEDIMRIEKQITELTAERDTRLAQKPTDITVITARVKYFLRHLDELLLKQIDPVKKAQFFGAVFNTAPNYEELKIGHKDNTLFTGVNELFQLSRMPKSDMVLPEGLEPPTMVPKTIVISISPREQINYYYS